MDGKRFDAVTRAWATNGSRRRVIGGMLAAAIAGVLPKRVAAQDLGDAIRDSIASAGNGGIADASANGGAVSIGNINSGGNAGNAIGIGDTVGSVGVNGGTVGNVTDVGVTADGGTAIADASGGDENVAAVLEEECRAEGQSCDANPECCGSLICCDLDDKCRHENDCCIEEGHECKHNPECCGGLVCCNDKCRHQRDCPDNDGGNGGGGDRCTVIFETCDPNNFTCCSGGPCQQFGDCNAGPDAFCC